MKLNLVIDASGIFYRSLFTVGSYGSRKNQRLLESEASQGVFMRKLATDFAALVKSVENVNRVIVCLDSTSWRKKIEIKDGGYKSGRKEKKEESNVDWEVFFKLTHEFSEILASHGYIISKVKDAEADDLLYLWSRKLNDMKESVIMVTGDKDLHQVINLHKNGSWTVALDPVTQRRKVVLSQEVYDTCKKEVESEEVDIFDPSTWTAEPGDILFSLVDRNDIHTIDPVKVATMKVLLGDGGDSVPGVVSWLEKKKTSDEEFIKSLTETKINKAISTLPQFTWRDLRDGLYIDELAKELAAVSKREVTVDELKKNIERNINLVVLDAEIIPEEIQKGFNLTVEKIEASPVHLTRDAILSGTKWWTDNREFVPKGYEFAIEDEDPLGEMGSGTPKTNDKDKKALQKAISDIKSKTSTEKGPAALF